MNVVSLVSPVGIQGMGQSGQLFYLVNTHRGVFFRMFRVRPRIFPMPARLRVFPFRFFRWGFLETFKMTEWQLTVKVLPRVIDWYLTLGLLSIFARTACAKTPRGLFLSQCLARFCQTWPRSVIITAKPLLNIFRIHSSEAPRLGLVSTLVMKSFALSCFWISEHICFFILLTNNFH